MAEFCMPTLGADMTKGTLIKWLVKTGEHVERGDVIAEVETDKADLEIEVFEAGIVERFLVEEGASVPVGTPLAIIASATGHPAPPAAAPSAGKDRVLAEPSERPTVAGPRRSHPRATPTARILATRLNLDLGAVPGSGVGGDITRADVERAAAASRAAPGGRGRASPRARRLALELGVSLETVRGTGIDGAVTGDDVQSAAKRPSIPGEPVPPQKGPVARRGPIAALMERSNREIPHYYLSLDIDVSATLEWLTGENTGKPVAERILFPALLLRAVAIAAAQVPGLNGYWQDGGFEPAADVNVGFAISLRGGGLVAPALMRVDQAGVTAVMANLRDLVTRSRSGRLKASELTSGTITVTSLGDLGVDNVFGLIFPPQVALVGFGRVRERPWAESGMLAVRRVITATLAADHRASDGHRGGLFLAAVEHALKEPTTL
ncbi:MAG: 2-oxo acid dehydrogenase subunit E2 [Anaerolineaceae bacterium]